MLRQFSKVLDTQLKTFDTTLEEVRSHRRGVTIMLASDV